MKRFTKTIASTTALFCLALPGCSGVNKSAQAPTAPLEQAADTKNAVALVNGVAITQAEVERAARVMQAQSGAANKLLPPDAMKKLTQAALDQLTLAELIYQEAAKSDLKNVEVKVERKLAEAKLAYPNEAAFVEALKGSGLTVQQMTQNIRKGIMITEFIEQRFATQATITEAEAEKFYQENLEKFFNTKESARASHILVKVEPTDSAEQKQQAKEKAEALLKRVKGGEDFAELAKAESACPSKAVGGDLGSFERGQMVGPFEQAVFALKPGEISEVVESSFGFHVIKLTEKKGATTMAYAEAKDKILEFLKQEKMRKLVAEYVEELRGKAKIERV